MSTEKRMRPITTLGGEPLRPNHLLVLLGYEAAELTERQAAELCGCGADVVGFRLLREWALANVRHVLAGGLPNIRKECRRCEHPICD